MPTLFIFLPAHSVCDNLSSLGRWNLSILVLRNCLAGGWGGRQNAEVVHSSSRKDWRQKERSVRMRWLDITLWWIRGFEQVGECTGQRNLAVRSQRMKQPSDWATTMQRTQGLGQMAIKLYKGSSASRVTKVQIRTTVVLFTPVGNVQRIPQTKNRKLKA